jgi:bifunctional non-homologous end joining protein LigD
MSAETRRLEEYRAKRDFGRTREPRDGNAPAGTGRFVIHEHSATRWHLDLRLERDGVLVSFALPNGLPDDPTANRKAVHTEDHPVEYLDFEGVIPEGQYGAGEMRVWDRGTYRCHSWQPKKIVVDLAGARLRGTFALFHVGPEEKDWLIHRMDQPATHRDPMPEHVVPMLARLSTLPRDDEGWAYEVKWDGVRAVGHFTPGRVRFESRTLNDITRQYPELRPLGRVLGTRTAVLDGEIVALDDRGAPSFELLQRRMHLTGEAEIRSRASSVPVTYMIFDLLYLDGELLLRHPYRERRALLESLSLAGPAWSVPASFEGEGEQFLEASRRQGLEGIVAKRVRSPYQPGKRTGDWLKVKNTARQEVVIGGWLPGKGRREGELGALLVGVFDDGRLRFTGKVGTGFDAATLADLRQRLGKLRRETSPFAGRQPAKGAIFVEPELVAEVEFTEWTSQGMLRHPSFRGLRTDKPPVEVVREHPEQADGDFADPVLEPLTLDDLLAGAEAQGDGRIEVEVDGRRLRLSNLDKVLWPKTGTTKAELIDYALRIAPVMLPQIKGHPLTLKRYPNGVDGPTFFEKRCPAHRPQWVQTEPVWSDRHHGMIDYCLVCDRPTLVWLANLAAIELHVNLSLAGAFDRPTMCMFDLDPGPGAGIVECCLVAQALQRMLERLGLESYAKTSGGKGLQVAVPLNHPDATFDETKGFARTVAELFEQELPDRVVARMDKSLRAGKVFIDWSQNDPYKSTICAYSPRGRPEPTVSTPVSSDEVERCAERGDPRMLRFTFGSVLERLDREGDLFGPVVSLVQQLPAGERG